MIAITALPSALLRLLILVHLLQGLSSMKLQAVPANHASPSGGVSCLQCEPPEDRHVLVDQPDFASSAILPRAIEEEGNEWLRFLSLAGFSASPSANVYQTTLASRSRSDHVVCQIARNAPLLI